MYWISHSVTPYYVHAAALLGRSLLYIKSYLKKKSYNSTVQPYNTLTPRHIRKTVSQSKHSSTSSPASVATKHLHKFRGQTRLVKLKPNQRNPCTNQINSKFNNNLCWLIYSMLNEFQMGPLCLIIHPICWGDWSGKVKPQTNDWQKIKHWN